MAYAITPFQPFSGTVLGLIEGEDATLYAAASATQYMGHSFDPVTRRLFFSSNVLVDSVASGSDTSKINDTGVTFLDYPNATSIAPLASYDGETLKNFRLHYMDVDTGDVTMVDPFDSTATIPNGKHGSDGTWRMVVASSVNLTNLPQFKLVDPRTGDCWSHMTDPQCNIYVFRDGEGFKQKLLPFGSAGHMEMLGITDDWVLVMASSTGALPRDNGQLYTIPRLTTASETSEGQLLGYFVRTQPTWMDTAYWRTVMTPNDEMYVFGNQRTGTRDYRLYRYDPPASVGSWTGSSQAGGTFTDITPWTGSTGPNTNCAAWTFDTTPGFNLQRFLGWKQNSVYSLPADNQLALLSILSPQSADNSGTNHDPAEFRIDCTYYDITNDTFDYHEGFVTGYMTADWQTTADPNEAAYAVQFIRETDTFREMNAYDYGDDYTERWIAFSVQPVVGGAFTWASSLAAGDVDATVLVKYRFAYGSAPEVVEFQTDASWLPFYGDYAAAIFNDNVVNRSILMDDGGNYEFAGGENYIAETGFVTDSGIWFGGWNAYSGLIDPTMPTYRGYIFDDTDPYPYPSSIVRLSWDTPPEPIAGQVSVWCAILKRAAVAV